MISFDLQIPNPNCLLGVVEARGVTLEPSANALIAQMQALAQHVCAAGYAFPQSHKDAIRRLLKAGGFKASGRNKPASEYLAQAVQKDGALPLINNVVDVNNTISLTHHLPASVVDAHAFAGRVTVRYGVEDERFVFNSYGQEITVAGLLSLCGGAGAGVPLANPVKDSMAAKLTDATRDVLAVVYASTECLSADEMGQILEQYTALLRRFCGASETETAVLYR